MADIATVLKKTIDGLPKNTPEIRQKVYEKVRATVRGKLEAKNPAPSHEAIDKQMVQVEKIITAVEGDYAFRDQIDSVFSQEKAVVAEEAVVDTGSEPAAVSPSPIPVEAPPVTEHRQEPVIASNAPVVSDQPEHEAAPLVPMKGDAGTARSSHEMDRAATDFFETALERDDPSPGMSPTMPDKTRDSRVSGVRVDAETKQAFDAPIPEPIVHKTRAKRSYAGVIWGLIFLLVLGGAGYAAWFNRDQIMALVSPSSGNIEVSEERESPPPAENVAVNEPDENSSEPDTSGTPKFTQRLQSDGTETDPGPSDGEASLGEGTSLAQLSEAGENGSGTSSDPTGAEAGEATAQPEEPTAQPAIAIGQRAIFYEERTAVEQGTAEQGNVIWSQVEETPGGDKPPEPAIRADISIPGRNLDLRMTIRRNGDETLPASHIIELVFVTPDTFPGGVIDEVLRISFKEDEQSAGTPLLGIPAKIADNFFLIALTDGSEEVRTNTALLGRRNWIDIPVVYRTGRRALITMEKGLPGEKVFNDVLQAWASSNQ